MSITTFSVFNVLYMLAGGYIIYNAPFFRYFCTRQAGYIFYYRVLTVGLGLFSVLYMLVQPYSPINFDESWFGVKAIISTDQFYLVLVVAIIIRLVGGLILWVTFKLKPQREHQWQLKRLADSEFNLFVYEGYKECQMMMLTLDSMKVYVGLSLPDLEVESSKWFRMATKFSGYRDEKSNAHLNIDYSRVLGDDKSILKNPMLIAVDKIISVQLFNPETFAEFNKNGTKENTATLDT